MLAKDRTRLSAFQLEGEAIVAVSPIVEAARGLPSIREAAPMRGNLFPDEVLTRSRPPGALDASVAAWLALRHARPPIGAREYAGFVAPRPPESYRVSQVDRYVACPFKYFAEHEAQAVLYAQAISATLGLGAVRAVVCYPADT